MILRFLCFLFFLLHPLHATQIQEDLDNGAVVFVYHRFGEVTLPSTNIRIQQFEDHLDYLQANNYNVISLTELLSALKEHKTLAPRTVALTMDDAYYSVYTRAFPMLKERNFPFSVFVNTNPIDNGSKNYVTWDQMREMQKGGGEFFNHSLSHDYLLKKEDETIQEAKKRIKNEVLQAQKRLDQELGVVAHRPFAYPFGEYDLCTKEMLRSLNIIAFAQNSGPIGHRSDLQALTRFPMSEIFAHMPAFILKLNTLQFPLRSISPQSPRVTSQNPPTLRIELEHPIAGISCYLSDGKKIEIDWISQTQFEVKAPQALKGERDLYTCTAPAKDGRWYWYSHLWIVAKR